MSVAFDIGAGAAAITRARTEPTFTGDVYASRRFVPVGSLVPVNVSVMGGTNEAQRFTDQWWAMDGIDVIVEYTDADG